MVSTQFSATNATSVSQKLPPTQDKLLGLEFSGIIPEDQKHLFIINLDTMIAHSPPEAHESIAAALTNNLRRTPENYKIIKEAVDGLERGSPILGHHASETITHMKAAVDKKHATDPLRLLKADASLPKRMSNPTDEVIRIANHANSTLDKIENSIAIYSSAMAPWHKHMSQEHQDHPLAHPV